MIVVRLLVAIPLGLILGSFNTVAIHRIPRGESVVAPRSRCPACGTRLRNADNIPVVSWLLLRGRCRACGAPISPMYPLTELATAVLFAAAALTFHRIWVAVTIAPFLGLMVALAVIDIRHRIIPNRLVYPSFVIFAAAIVVADLAGAGPNAPRAALGTLAYGGGLLVVALVSPRGMGMGDVKLAGLIGLVLGALGLRFVAVAAGAGVLLGGVAAIAALIAGASRKQALPFGPFLAAGAVVAALFGEQLASAYLRIVG